MLLGIAGWVIMSNEHIRVPLINYYLDHSESDILVEVFFGSCSSPKIQLDLRDPLAGIIPEGFTLYQVLDDRPERFIYEYRDAADRWVNITGQNLDVSIDMSTEGALVIEDRLIGGWESVIVVDAQYVSILWVDHYHKMVFSMITKDITTEEAVALAEGMQKRVDGK